MNSKGRMPAAANLDDYEKVYSTFRWADAEREMGLDPEVGWNMAVEAVDRQAEGRHRQKAAFRFFDGLSSVTVTYHQLKLLTNRFANALRALGVAPGERVALFLPPLPEFYVAFLGVIKLGAIVVPLSPVFMNDALTEMLRDSEASVVVTLGELLNRIERGKLPAMRRLIVVGSESSPAGEWVGYGSVMAEAAESFTAVPAAREAPIMLLYTSGSTAKPKGVIHVQGGIAHYYQSGKWVLDFREQDVYWCTSGPSWVPGISYGIWAPLLHGVTSIIYSGDFAAARWYEILTRFKVTVWYTTPTALRRLMNFGPDNPQARYGIKDLRHILTVGEPLNPAVIRWSEKAFGLKVYDTWWMTETGGQMIANFRSVPLKPGSMGRPLPGIEASIVDEEGREVPAPEVGQLAIRAGWPAMMGGIWKDEEKYRDYFRMPPWYLTGDLAYKDADGYFWFQGRADDVIKKAGERIGPIEIENKLSEHPAVLEAGVVGRPDPLWGEVIKAFVVLRPEYSWSAELRDEIRRFVESRLGPRFVPRDIEVCAKLPRTTSGKLMRRVLKAMELGFPVSDVSDGDD
ncbi:acetyl-coenzyme A synthetase [Peptococcaceae bacterium CEB3]|nr:acetyl-coenzyme A synthetase [Peptococcaceae bacterium CEB3]